MENKNLLSVPLKTEVDSTIAKKILLPSKNFSQLSIRNGSSIRLRSFKPPRDLLLTDTSTNYSSSCFKLNKNTKKTFIPNINVTRKKYLSIDAVENNSNLEGLQKSKDKNRKSTLLKKKISNIVQTKGVFSEGLAPRSVKAFKNVFSEKTCKEKQVLDKPKLNLNQKINKVEEDNKFNALLKDDLDDPSPVSDFNIMPSSLPLVFKFKKTESCENLKIPCDVSNVKTKSFSVNAHVEDFKQEVPTITSVLEEKQNPKLFLFEFPSILKEKQEKFVEKKKNTKAQTTDSETEKSDNLTLLGEGFLGTLRIHENGKAFLIIGKATIPLCLIRHATKQELMSTEFNQENLKGEIISLGSIDSSFTCSSNLFQDIS